MPKVGTKCVKINEKWVDLILWYTQKDGFSYRGIPNELYNLVKGFTEARKKLIPI